MSLKKHMAVAIFACFFAADATAQVKFMPGVRGGVNFSSITDTDLDGKTDFYLGGFAAIQLSRVYTLQPEISYSRQGADGDITNYDPILEEDATRYFDIELNYVSLALINKFTLLKSFNVHFGPFLDILAGGKTNNDANADIGFTTGIGYTAPFGLTLEARVKIGAAEAADTAELTNYYDGKTEFFNYDGNGNNFLLSVGLAYSFDLKRTSK